MILKNLLPTEKVQSMFMGRGEDLQEILKDNFTDHKIIEMEQTHSDQILFLDEQDLEGAEGQHVLLPIVDGVFTDQKKVVLMVKGADCYPILFYHPSGVIGAIHAGRKGTEQEIVKKALSQLKEERGLTEGWRIWLGPKICVNCYQIDRETDEHYDLQAKNAAQIQSVLNGETNFAVDSGFCTAHQNDWFYSYRKEGSGLPMNYGLVAIN